MLASRIALAAIVLGSSLHFGPDISSATTEIPRVDEGAYLITWSDGTSGLSYITPDSSYYHSRQVHEGNWEATIFSMCLHLESGERVCLVPSAISEHGTYISTRSDGSTLTVLPLGRQYAAGDFPFMGPNAAILHSEDGSRSLRVWLEDGTTRAGALTEEGRVDVDGERICFISNSSSDRNCSTNQSPGQDGSWWTVPDEGEPYRVLKIL